MRTLKWAAIQLRFAPWDGDDMTRLHGRNKKPMVFATVSLSCIKTSIHKNTFTCRSIEAHDCQLPKLKMAYADFYLFVWALMFVWTQG